MREPQDVAVRGEPRSGGEPSGEMIGVGLGPRRPRRAYEMKPRVEIEYCTQCRWLLRAAWMAQELLTTFEAELGEVALVPGTGGIFEIRAEGQLVWSRHERKRFPEIKELKQAVRDAVAPGKSLGHADRGSAR